MQLYIVTTYDGVTARILLAGIVRAFADGMALVKVKVGVFAYVQDDRRTEHSSV